MFGVEWIAMYIYVHNIMLRLWNSCPTYVAMSKVLLQKYQFQDMYNNLYEDILHIHIIATC